MNRPAILYIDDDESDIVIMEIYMERHGIEVHASCLTRDGITLFDPHRHTLTVIDWNLCDDTGLGAAQKIREKCAGAPIVFLSAIYTDEQLREAKTIQPLACLEKHASMQHMTAIAELVRAQRNAA